MDGVGIGGRDELFRAHRTKGDLLRAGMFLKQQGGVAQSWKNKGPVIRVSSIGPS